MRVVFLILILILISGFTFCKAQTCHGEYKARIYPGDTLLSNECGMVIMNDETYADFFHTKKNFIKLKEKVPQWQETIDSLEAETKDRREKLDSAIIIKEKQFQLERQSKEDLLYELVEIESENFSLKRKNKTLGALTTYSTCVSIGSIAGSFIPIIGTVPGGIIGLAVGKVIRVLKKKRI